MALTDVARKNHDALFPGHVSTLAGSDPELVEIFGNFAFDEILRRSELPTRLRLIVQLAAIIGVGAVGEYRVMLGAALDNGVTPIEAKETLYQAVPYVGIARAVDFLHAANEVMRQRGVALPLPPQAVVSRENRAEKGAAAMAAAVGAATVAGMRRNFPADQQHMIDYLAGFCFGDHYSRRGLDLPTRELATLSLLAGLGGCEPQIRGHVAANLNVGADRALLVDVVTQLLPFIGFPRCLNALRAIDEIAA